MPDSKQLEERVKELTCLYRISSLDEKELSIKELLQRSTAIMADAVQYPERCLVEIAYEGRIYKNNQLGSSIVSIHFETETSKGSSLEIQLFYDEEGGGSESIPEFLQEEKAMLEAVCKQLASKLNWIHANKELELHRMTQNRSYLNANIGSWEYNFKKNQIHLSEVLITLLKTEGKQIYTPDGIVRFITSKKDRDRLKREAEEAIDTHSSFSLELNVRTGSGKKIWMKVVGEPLYRDDTFISLFGTVQNIQRRKKIEKALSQRNQFIEAALDHLPIGIAVNTTDDGKRVLMNQKFSEVYGWPEHEITDVDTFFKRVYPDKDYRKMITRQIREDIESGDASRMFWDGVKITQQSGEERIVNAKNIPVYQQKLMISTVTDVTEKYRAEEKLKANERRFKALVQDGSDLIAIINLNGEFTYVSPASELILGIKPDDAIGKKMINFVHRDDRDKILDIMNNLPRRRRFVIKQVRFKSEKGQFKWLEASVTNLLYDSSVEGFVINAHDITRRIEDQNEIKQALAEKEVLLSEIHHRVKNNLAVISGMLQLQLFDESNPVVQEKLNEGMLRIQTMANIHELLYNTSSFSKLSFSEIIQQLAKNVADTMSGKADVEVKIDSDAAELNINQAIPCALIINEVLTNIFKHAFKGMDKGKVTISVKQIGRVTELFISDNGVGLPEDFSLSDNRSLGKNIIRILSEQLEADYNLYDSGNGTSFELHFRADALLTHKKKD